MEIILLIVIIIDLLLAAYLTKIHMTRLVEIERWLDEML